MALFSYGTDTLRSQKKTTGGGILGLLRGKQAQTATQPGQFNGPVRFRAPGTPFNANDLTITQNPNGPKPPAPAEDPYHLYAGKPPAAKAAAAPVQGPAAPPKAPVAPKPVTAAAVPPKPPTPPPTTDSGFNSTDPAVLARIKAMQDQAGGATPPPAAPPPSPTVSDAAASGASQPKSNIDISLLRGDRTPEQSRIDALRKGYLSTFAPSDSEKALQDELASFRESANLGVAGLEGQGRGIPLDLVRGQQAILEKQAGIKEQSLLGRLQLEQQNRELAQKAAEAELGFATQDVNAQKPGAPIEIGGNLVQLNPATGQYETVYQGAAAGTKPLTVGVGETVIDPTTGQVIYSSPGAEAKPITISAGQSIVDPSTGKVLFTAPRDMSDKTYTLSPGQVVVDANGNVIAGGGTKPPTAEQSKAAGFAQRVNQAGQVIDQLESQFTGLTSQLGFVPEYLKTENRKLLEQAENNFINAVLRRESGAAISPSEFENARKQYFPQPGDGAAVLQQKKQNRDSVYQSLQAEASGRLPGDDVDQFLDSFSGDLSRSVNGSAASIANAIKKVESGGDYTAEGGSGEFGAYQFMPSSWKAWAGKYLGDPNASMTPRNQDQVAHARIQELLDQGYDAGEIALIWNGGTPTVKKGVNRFGVAYDSGAYANKVLNALA